MITKGNKTVVDIFYGNKPISKVYKGDIIVFEAQRGPIPPPTGITQFTLDQNISDPTKMVTGVFGKKGNPKKHVVSWIRANSHRYVGTYNTELGMVLKQLSDKDSTKYADGTDASIDITTKDVFMKMPDFWFRGESLDSTNNRYNIYFSAIEPADDNSWIKWDGNTLIGVYEAACQDTGNNGNGELYSRSGVTPTASVSQTNFKTKSRNRSNGDDHFMLVTYEAHQVMALLYIAYYGDNMNAQTIIGSGTPSYPKVAGQTDIDGMKDTVAQNSRSINFWGLENWWGDVQEFMDNLTIAGAGSININNYDGEVERVVKGLTTTYGFTMHMVLGEKLDLMPSNLGGTATTYYCDYTGNNNKVGCVARRGSSSNSLECGPFSLLILDAPGNSQGNYGSRLQYHGRVVIADANTALINSVDLAPVTLNTKKAASTPSVTVVIKGDNLDKLDDNITGLPEGATVSWLSEGTTERVVTITGVSSLESLKFNFGGYEVSIVNPDSLPADLQRVFYNEKKALRTGMDFHICNVEDFFETNNIKLQGLNINYSDIGFDAAENTKVSSDSEGNLVVKSNNSYDDLEIGLIYKDRMIGTLKIHKSSEEDILKALEKEREQYILN